MSLISNTFVLSTLAAFGSATFITSDFRIPGVAIGLGTFNAQTTIEAGASYWLSGLGTHNIYGDLTVNGALTISQTDWTSTVPGGQTCDWTGGSLANLGNILLNDISALSAPTYNWWLDHIKNEAGATIQWCGRGDTGGSTYHMSSKNDLVNDGLIVFEQVGGNWGTAMTFQNTVPTISALQASSNVYNNGGFLIRKARLDIMQQILGSGCWMIDADAVLYLQDGLSAFNNYGYKPSLNGQSISFVGASGTLHMDTAVYSRNKLFGAKLFNFGIGHSIEFYEKIKGISYNGLAGVLSVSFYSRNSVDIEIGKGYDGSKFSFSARASFYASFNAIFYSGQAPSQSAPDKCQLTASTCQPVTGPQTTSSVLPPVSTSTRVATTLTSSVASPPYGGQSTTSAALSSSAKRSTSLPGSTSTSLPSLPPYGQPSSSSTSFSKPVSSSQGVPTSSARASSTSSAAQSSSTSPAAQSSSSKVASSSSAAQSSSAKASSSSSAAQSSSAKASSSSSAAQSSSAKASSTVSVVPSSSSKASSTVRSATPSSSSAVKTSSSASIPVYPGASSSSVVVSTSRPVSVSSPSVSPVRTSSISASGPSTSPAASSSASKSSVVSSSRPASTGASSCAAQQITITSVVSAQAVTSTVTVQAGPVVSTLTLPAVTLTSTVTQQAYPVVSTVTLPAVTVTQPAITVTKPAVTVTKKASTVTKKAGTKTVTKVTTVTSCPNGGYPPSPYDDNDNSGYDSYGLPSYNDDNSGYDSY